MRETTRSALAALENLEWFAHVGERDADVIDYVSSWDEAIELCSAIEWENYTLEAANKIGDAVLAQSKDDYNRWNDITADIKPTVKKLVELKANSAAEENNLPKVFFDDLSWNLVGYALELEYSEFSPPNFFSGLVHWYRIGHFPCGWNEKNNRLIVY